MTKTYEKDGLGLYIHKIVRRNDDWFLSIWNEVPASRRGAMSIPGNNRPEEAKIQPIKSGSGAIVGFPSYFWFPRMSDSQIDTVLILRIPTAPRSVGSLKRAIRGFLERHSQHVLYEDEDDGDDIVITGYAEYRIGAPQEGVYPSFNIKRLTHDSEIDQLRQHCEDIVQVVMKGGYKRIFTGGTRIASLIRWIGIGAGPTDLDRQSRASIRMAVPVNGLRKNDFNTIVQKYGDEWDDIGFRLRRDSRIHWLSKGFLKVDQELQIGTAEDDIVELEALAGELIKARDSVLGGIGQ